MLLNTKEPALVLVAEDDDSMRQAAAQCLRSSGYRVLAASDGAQALATATRHPVDVFLIDAVMPELDGFTLCRELRKFSTAAVLMWTSLAQSHFVRRGFLAGVDDYIAKSLGFRQVLERLDVLSSWTVRTVEHLPDVVEIGPVCLDNRQHEVYWGGERVYLSPIEYRFLRCLLENPKGPVSRRLLAGTLCGSYLENANDVVDIIAQRLRMKLEADPAQPAWLLSDLSEYRLLLA